VRQLRETYPRDFFVRPTLEVAPDLLGALLCRRLDDGSVISAAILEVEAYTQDDSACHAFRGLTERVKVMFGPPGYAYVYFIYGAYYCLNVVTEPAGVAGAILLRAIEAPGGDGPGKLCRLLQIDKRQYGADLCNPEGEVWIARSERLADEKVATSPRVGVSSAEDRSWRFFVKDHKGVSVYRKYAKKRVTK
jgi:DNA-3-methyladenine glycosylase